jgi:hypothetical protein
MRNTGHPEVDKEKSGLLATITSLFRKLSPDLFHDEITTERERYKWEDARLFDLDPARQNKYKDYEEMDEEIVELSSALDIYADFITAADSETGEVYSVELAGEEKKNNIADALEKIDSDLQMKQRVWFISRHIAEYGETFYENIASEEKLVDIKYLPEEEMFLNYDLKTGRQRKDIPYIQRDLDSWAIIAQFEPWEIVHFKVGEDDYGVDYSVLAKLRRTFRILRMLEDSLLKTRVSRSGQRGVYKVDATGMGEMETARYIRHLKILNRRRRFFSEGGKMRTEADPLAQLDDIYIPVRKGGAESDYTIVGGGDTSLGEIRDVEHFHNKLFAATKVPKAYLGYERDINAKSTLIQQNIAFARAIKRQRFALATGLKKIYKIGLSMQGIDSFSFEWKIKFPALGEADEESKWAIEQLKAEVVKTYGEIGLRIPDDWIIKKLFMDLQPSEADELLSIVGKEKEKEQALQKQQQQALQKQQQTFNPAVPPQGAQGKKPGPKGTPLTRPKPPYTLARPDSVSDLSTPSVTELDDLYQKIKSDDSLWKFIQQKESEIREVLQKRVRYEKY